MVQVVWVRRAVPRNEPSTMKCCSQDILVGHLEVGDEKAHTEARFPVGADRQKACAADPNEDQKDGLEQVSHVRAPIRSGHCHPCLQLRFRPLREGLRVSEKRRVRIPTIVRILPH